MPPNPAFDLCITRAENARLHDAAGRTYLDLFSAHGTTWLGHANPVIAAALRDQLERVWITGGLATPALAAARTAIAEFFPPEYRLAALYSTGMEAAEFALRLARVCTGKRGVIGFAGCLHGKSLATAYLGWDNHDGIVLPEFQRLPFVATHAEADILAELETALRQQAVGAVFLEPMQGSGGGYRASAAFYEEVHRLCRRHGALLIFDELLTGFYRTGRPFFFSELTFVPDVVLIGKALGNGFPVSGVVVQERYSVSKAMLPGSTFAGNPLAAAVVAATLCEMQRLDLPRMVRDLEGGIRRGLEPLTSRGITLRGHGAMWILELPSGLPAEEVAGRLVRRGVALGFAGCYLRVLPAATIALEHLDEACATIRAVLQEACHG